MPLLAAAFSHMSETQRHSPLFSNVSFLQVERAADELRRIIETNEDKEETVKVREAIPLQSSSSRLRPCGEACLTLRVCSHSSASSWSAC
jgi:hypothetical protein